MVLFPDLQRSDKHCLVIMQTPPFRTDTKKQKVTTVPPETVEVEEEPVEFPALLLHLLQGQVGHQKTAESKCQHVN